jgi:hypothetical protein
MHRVGRVLPPIPGAGEPPATKPSLRVLAEDGTPLIIRWTPNGPECDYRGYVSPETTRRIEAAMRREWLFGISKNHTAEQKVAEEQRHHQRQHNRDNKYSKIGPPMGHWTDSLGVLTAQYNGNCRLCDEPWNPGDRISWHRIKGAFHIDCAKNARDRRLSEPAPSKFRKQAAPLPPWPPPGEERHFTDKWRILRANRNSECEVCGGLAVVGEPILWSPEDRFSRHYACGLLLRTPLDE